MAVSSAVKEDTNQRDLSGGILELASVHELVFGWLGEIACANGDDLDVQKSVQLACELIHANSLFGRCLGHT